MCAATRSNPARGQTAARELIAKQGAVMRVGGTDSPVAKAIVPLVNRPGYASWGVGGATSSPRKFSTARVENRSNKARGDDVKVL